MTITSVEQEFTPIYPTHQKWQKDGPTVSFSEISTWLECPFRHMLAYVKRIDTFEKNVHTTFGGVAHTFCESFLFTRHKDLDKRTPEPLTKEEAVFLLTEQWTTDGLGDPKVWVNPDDPTDVVDWTVIMERVIDDIGPFMDVTFGSTWSSLGAETKLFEDIDGQPLKFKGYIDGVLITQDRFGKDIYWLIDWKFTNHWSPEKKSDINVQLQLILYKYFWALKNNIPLSRIRCGFILAKKKAKVGKTFELVAVSVGPKTLEKGLKILKNMLSAVRKGMFLKKKMNCKYCPYQNTELCP